MTSEQPEEIVKNVMKAANNFGGQNRNRKSRYMLDAPSRAESAVFAALGVAALAAILVAAAFGSNPATLKTEQLAAVRRSQIVRYISSGQLVADTHTAAAMVRYLLEPEWPLVTNAIALSPTKHNAAMPTNHSVLGPKA
jgi:hypothetical protein